MKICALCRNEIETDKYFSRKSECPKCGRDLYICLNCRFYSVSSHNKCLETKADFQRTRDKANFCDYFSFKESSAAFPAQNEKDDAKKKFDELFRK